MLISKNKINLYVLIIVLLYFSNFWIIDQKKLTGDAGTGTFIRNEIVA